MSSNQGQHRISQVYLRQFGFRDKNNAETISVLEVGNPITHHKKIKSFTKETNLFDTSLADEGFSRYFEEYSQKVEMHYPRVISEIKRTGKLDRFGKNQLIHFVSNLFIRQVKTREYFLIPILKSKSIRKKLSNEITLFAESPDLLKAVLEEIVIDTDGTINDKLNLIACEIWGHLRKVFNQFTFVVLKAQDGTGWFTSDNPVIVNRKGNVEAWMIPPQAEIYFPLSSDYLLFMYNHRVKTNNPIAFFPKDVVSYVTNDIQHSIMIDQITKSAEKYYISCTDLGITDVRKA